MHTRFILIIIVVTLLIFANALSNGFVGDDMVVFAKNSFYDSWQNFPKIFSQEYITDGNDFNTYIEGAHKKGSGSIGYRPVLSATYFVDRWLWGQIPFGYHLHNVILHILNAVLVYILVFFIFRNKSTALLSALLFALHPTKTEAVCSIGYRADSLSCLFALCSFLLFLQYRQAAQEKRKWFYGGSLAFFFLGLFSKESVAVLPGLCFAYDWLFSERDLQRDWTKILKRYSGYAAVLAFYLYVYLFVFRNSTLGQIGFLNGTFFHHVVTILLIFLRYIVYLIFPISVETLIPLYVPAIDAFWAIKSLVALSIFVALIMLVIQTRQRAKGVAFFTLWFLISLIPVMNIIPIANPMAHRFLYFPSIGFLVVAAVGIEKLCAKTLAVKGTSFNIGKVLKNCVIAMCMIQTFTLNGFWRDNLTMAMEFVRRYPKNPHSYMHLGGCAFHAGKTVIAIKSLEHSLNLGAHDPRIHYLLGLCYARIDPDISIAHYKEAVYDYPNFHLAYIGLAREMLLFKSDKNQALAYLKKAFEFSPTYAGYGYLIQIYLMENNVEKAQKILKEAEKNIRNDDQLRSLRNFLRLKDQVTLPVDIGV